MIIVPEKYKQLTKDIRNFNSYNFDNINFGDMSVWKQREEFRQSVSWHVPTWELVQLIKKYCPIVSIGCGYAYTEHLVQENGGDIIATDKSPGHKNKWCEQGNSYIKVEKLTAIQSIKKYKNRNVFMVWPPYGDKMAYDVAKNMTKEKYLIYVGESYGGCTGDGSFFDYIEKHFQEIETDVLIPSWWGIHDHVALYQKA